MDKTRIRSLNAKKHKKKAAPCGRRVVFGEIQWVPQTTMDMDVCAVCGAGFDFLFSNLSEKFPRFKFQYIANAQYFFRHALCVTISLGCG